jgi:hypothetical protein
MIIKSELPFILLPDIIPFGKVDKICNRFGGEKRKSVYNVNLRAMVTLVFQSFTVRVIDVGSVQKRRLSQWHVGALLPPQ